MQDNRKISLIVTHCNQTDIIMSALAYPALDNRISEIIICDNNTNSDDFKQLVHIANKLSKVKILPYTSNESNNVNMFKTIGLARNEFTIVMNASDCITKSFVDKLYLYKAWNPLTMFVPSKSDLFDISAINGDIIRKDNAAYYGTNYDISEGLNGSCYFVNVKHYCDTYEISKSDEESINLWNKVCWIQKGMSIYVVPDLEYLKL